MVLCRIWLETTDRLSNIEDQIRIKFYLDACRLIMHYAYMIQSDHSSIILLLKLRSELLKIAIFQPSYIFETSKDKFDQRMTSLLKYNGQVTLICHQPQI